MFLANTLTNWQISLTIARIMRIPSLVTSGALAAIALTGATLLFLPILPSIQFWLFPPAPDMSSMPLFDFTRNAPGSIITDQTNRLLIPKIGVDAAINEGETIDVLNEKQGLWREPGTSTPSDGGNTVIAGHRFQYLPPNTNTLYLLDKLSLGDSIIAHWEGREYRYTIDDIFEVDPSEIGIRNNSDHSEITIYSCTPIGSTARRLVIKARLL